MKELPKDYDIHTELKKDYKDLKEHGGIGISERFKYKDNIVEIHLAVGEWALDYDEQYVIQAVKDKKKHLINYGFNEEEFNAVNRVLDDILEQID